MKTDDYRLERKFCAKGVVTLDQDFGLAGYASLFVQEDQGGDIVGAGAFAQCLDRLRAEGGAVRMLWQHDPAEPIGVWDEIVEDARGLWVKGRLLPGVARAREAAALIGAGAIDGLSIGYRAIAAEKDGRGRRVLTEVDLWEVSLVTFPMLRTARVAAKAEDEGTTGAAGEGAWLGDIAAALVRAAAELAGRPAGAVSGE